MNGNGGIIRTFELFCVFVATAAAAQTPRPTFDVASVRKLDQPAPSNQSRSQGTTFSRTSATVASLVQFAYNIQPFLLIGGPE
jgi:hypothetical protein